MGYFSMFVLLTTTSQILAAPQFITFKEGKVGVNFGGYHAAAGLGGLLGAGGAGGLFAEAGTPHGQSARAGLGGGVSEGGSGGGLYAGATAGGNVGASAGLAGGVGAGSSAGVGYAAASAGDHHAGAGMGGVHKNVHADFDFDAANEVNAPPLTNVHVQKEIGVAVETHAKPEVHAEPQPPVVIEKHIYHTQPVVVEKHHKRPHRLHNKFLAHGYIGGAAEVAPPPIGKRIDVGVESVANVGAHAESGAVANGGGQVSYTKQVQFQRNPQFFADIFNIPISTLKAVGSFLGNAAGSTSVSVQKSASVQGGAGAAAFI